ncbi:MAG: hypothetical protein EXS16_00735 [Gemmataceae bacterium]|nr:hypothetical protein [Gemmataceae bacterium]
MRQSTRYEISAVFLAAIGVLGFGFAVSPIVSPVQYEYIFGPEFPLACLLSLPVSLLILWAALRLTTKARHLKTAGRLHGQSVGSVKRRRTMNPQTSGALALDAHYLNLTRDVVLQPVAEMRLQLLRPGAKRKVALHLCVGAPQPESDDWYCPVLLKGLIDNKERRIVGVDSWQALILALGFVESLLQSEIRNGAQLFQLGHRTSIRSLFGSRVRGQKFAAESPPIS